jgi:hypothetical protein
VRYTVTGSHTGELMGIVPTGQESSITESPSCISRTGRSRSAGIPTIRRRSTRDFGPVERATGPT